MTFDSYNSTGNSAMFMWEWLDSRLSDDNQYDDNSNQQYLGYTGHMSNTDMPSV